MYRKEITVTKLISTYIEALGFCRPWCPWKVLGYQVIYIGCHRIITT